MQLNNNRLLNIIGGAILLAVSTQFAQAEVHIVEMKKYKFIPDEITIKVGDTIKWLNTERRQYHTIWFKEAGEKTKHRILPR